MQDILGVCETLNPTSADQGPRIELAVESCLAAAVRRRVTNILWREHASADSELLDTAAGLADGSARLMPRSASMLRDSQVAGLCGTLCVWAYQLISSLCHVKSSTGTGLVDSSAYPTPLSASMLQKAQARGPVTSAAQPIILLCPSLTDAVWPLGNLNLFASTCVMRTYPGVLRDPCHDMPFPTQALQTRERSTSPRSPVSTASAADGLPAEVLALCGVAGPLRQLDLSAPAAAMSRLEDMACPLEGITTLQVLQNVNCI